MKLCLRPKFVFNIIEAKLLEKCALSLLHLSLMQNFHKLPTLDISQSFNVIESNLILTWEYIFCLNQVIWLLIVSNQIWKNQVFHKSCGTDKTFIA